MSDEEVEKIAELLAKVGGSWFPERTKAALRAINSRHRDVARLVIAELDRTRGVEQEADSTGSPASGGADPFNFAQDDQLYVGATVVYRPPGEKRAITCRVEKMDHGRAYLVPAPREIGWVSVHTLLPLKS
ncbi:hypothetical protein [Microvirga roseola]|uniref:hypothetical protein n=1 Tax=Microvirga roseola TaxID=2883126 RepID=UPI001E42E25A|nr:hypothetical protein [Microvirga roseola]